jgi:hypothetical protein
MKFASTGNLLRSIVHISIFGLSAALLAPIGAALAADEVGVAVNVRNDVTGKIQSQTVKIDGGSNVFGREIVKTNADSSAKIVLKDNTNLNVGPNSSVSLDNFVFKGDSDYQQAGFNLAKGAFRFTSGGSDKRAYDLKTPAATIGVRGTDFVVLVKNKVSHVEVATGSTLICPVKAVSKEVVALDNEKKKKCQKEDPNDKQCGCTRKCAEVVAGKAVDVSDEYVCASDFTGVQVGEEAMSFSEASAGLPIEGLLVGAAIIGIGVGTGISVSNPNNPSTPPLIPVSP